MDTEIPKISFGIIVLNGMPFVEYCLRQIYPFAFEIIVVEGASEKAAMISDEKGHSVDKTVDALKRFKSQEDPEDKVQLIFREGFWPGKDAMSQAYAEKATGDWLWQVDIDEFYKHEDMEYICRLLVKEPDISAISFRQIAFWGDFDILNDSVHLCGNNASEFFRLFKWGAGFQYVTHRPPTVINPQGRNVLEDKWLNARVMEKNGILLYHYSTLFPRQVRDKSLYYAKQRWGEVAKRICYWEEHCFNEFRHPFRVHQNQTSLSWLKKFHGIHPEAIQQLQEDLKQKRLHEERFDLTKARKTLDSHLYRLKAQFLEFYSRYFHAFLNRNPLLVPFKGTYTFLRSRLAILKNAIKAL